MADPRNVIDHREIDNLQVTMKHDSSIVYSVEETNGSAQAGLAVKMTTTDDTVALTTDASGVFGKLIQVEKGGYCTVQIRGFAQFAAGDSATFTIGAGIVGALGASSAQGYIRGRAAATLAEVAVQRGRVTNDGTTTAVMVDLG
jgi:hypothetical protein